MKIAVEGCAHGELEKIYECLEVLQARERIKIDLLICCGDFQAVRNNDDLCTMAVPPKYLNICTFYKYYSGEKKAPVLTIFIGGNHEASNYLQELPYGGWVAPNIYYMGRSGCVKFGDLKIAGLSGIFKGRDYLQGYWETPPYDYTSMRSVYHVRAFDAYRLKQLKERVHVMLSHDWPKDIAYFGDVDQLYRKKPYLREEVENHTLGSPAAEKILLDMKPDYWFAAHMHYQFAAIVRHQIGTTATNMTKFLALDKCLPRRRHLQILHVDDFDGDKRLKHDVEWLAILKNTNHLLPVRNIDTYMPGPGGNERHNFTPSEEEKAAIVELMGDNIYITEDSFVRTAPFYKIGDPIGRQREPVENPQTAKLCQLLGIDDPLQVVLARAGKVLSKPLVPVSELSTVSPSEPSTPQRNMKLSLPAPITPSTCDGDSIMNVTSVIDTSCVSTPSGGETSMCSTPVWNGKKPFKRRNQAMYSTDSSSNSPLYDFDTPKAVRTL